MHIILEDRHRDSDIVWTSQELLQKLRHYYANRDILVPDNDFYGNIRTKQGLENAAHTMQRHLKLKSDVSYTFSHKVSWPGQCTIKRKKAIITLPRQALAKPLLAIANIAHLLVHISLQEHRISHIDPSENEKLVDLAAIYSGLGVVIVNGLHRGGWSSHLKQHKRPSCLGNLTEATFIQELKKQLPVSIQTSLASSTVTWERKRLYSNTSLLEKPRVIREADTYHDRSLRRAVSSLAALIVLVVLGALLINRSPAYTDTTLRALKSDAEELRTAYTICAQRLEQLQRAVPDDFTSERTISAEQVTCKSLENRYNNAVLRYNRYSASRE